MGGNIQTLPPRHRKEEGAFSGTFFVPIWLGGITASYGAHFICPFSITTVIPGINSGTSTIGLAVIWKLRKSICPEGLVDFHTA